VPQGSLVRFAMVGAACGALLLQVGPAAAFQSTPATATSSGAPKAVAGAKASKALRVGVVRGGSDSGMFLGPMISDGHFRGRLESSLEEAGYFAETRAAYEITVDMVDIQQPLFGSSASARIRYTVKPVGGGEPIFDQTVYSSGSTAIKTNIESFIKRLAVVLN